MTARPTPPRRSTLARWRAVSHLRGSARSPEDDDPEARPRPDRRRADRGQRVGRRVEKAPPADADAGEDLLDRPRRHAVHIARGDRAGWEKARGLHVARAWHPARPPLVEMADPGGLPHRGALLFAEIGAGRHTHCARVLALQMAALAPGTFRLMTDMIAPRA